MKNITIAIDGPAGSGKSTSARLVAQKLHYTYLDTGAMYRAITLGVLESGKATPAGEDAGGISVSESDLCGILSTLDVRVELNGNGQRTLLNGMDVSSRIRESDVTRHVSYVSSLASVRQQLVRMQQELGAHGGIVMDGRDIGTVVFPKAELKIFLVASIEARARRRLAEQQQLLGADLENVAAELERRDELDSTRAISPLLKAPDAVEIDTSDLSIEQQVQRIVELAMERIADGHESKT